MIEDFRLTIGNRGLPVTLIVNLQSAIVNKVIFSVSMCLYGQTSFHS